MKKKILEIRLEDETRSFMENLKDFELQLAVEIVSRICDAIDEGVSYVDAVTITTPYHKITLTAHEKNYIETLEVNKETLIKYEEFELCARIVKCIEKLKEKNLVNK
jgi:hypothetical protein